MWDILCREGAVKQFGIVVIYDRVVYTIQKEYRWGCRLGVFFQRKGVSKDLVVHLPFSEEPAA